MLPCSLAPSRLEPMDGQQMDKMAVEKQAMAIIYAAPSTKIEMHFQPVFFPIEPTKWKPLKKLPTVQDQIHLFLGKIRFWTFKKNCVCPNTLKLFSN
jgi:hypothetical protein